MSLEPSTRVSLLDRLRQQPTDQQAWEVFVQRYSPTIYGWCRRWNLQEADAQDVTQNVLTILAVRMKTFTYDPQQRFRAWLHTVTRHAWSAFVEGCQRAPRSGDEREAAHLLESVPAREDLVRRLEERFDQELLELAMEQVRLRVEAHTWEAFRLTALERQTAAEVAGQLGMKVATVYVARSKVQKMIRAELGKLEEPPAVVAEEQP
jgi:RNA polymerase sigma-70 factor (ECF subfamily)